MRILLALFLVAGCVHADTRSTPQGVWWSFATDLDQCVSENLASGDSDEHADTWCEGYANGIAAARMRSPFRETHLDHTPPEDKALFLECVRMILEMPHNAGDRYFAESYCAGSLDGGLR